MTLVLSGTTGVSAVDGSAATPAIQGSDANTGMFFPAADTIAFAEGGAEVARFDSSGNFGLGVTPSAWASGYKALEFGNSATQTGALFSNGVNDSWFVSNAYFNGTNWIYKATGNATGFEQVAGSHKWYTAPSGTAGNAISFTQAMTLDSSGNLLVGTTSALPSVGKIQVGNGTGRAFVTAGSSGDVSTEALRIGKFDNNSTTSQLFVRFTINNDGAGSGQINANGASSAAFGSFSDERLKENIVSLPPQLSNICALRPVEFDYKDGSGHQIGFIAQEMQAVYPDVVAPADDEMLMVTGWSKTEARLVKAIQEQQALIAALQADVAALKGQA